MRSTKERLQRYRELVRRDCFVEAQNFLCENAHDEEFVRLVRFQKRMVKDLRESREGGLSDAPDSVLESAVKKALGAGAPATNYTTQEEVQADRRCSSRRGE